MANGTSSRHREFRDGDLPRRWLRRQDRAELPDAEDDPGDEVDAWWCPYCEWDPLDFELWRVWQDVLSVGFGSSLGIPGAQVGAPEPGSPPPATRVVFGDDVAVALHEHLQRIASPEGRAAYTASASFVAALGQLRAVLRRSPALLAWFNERRSWQGVLVFLLAPFWIRSLESWVGFDRCDPGAVIRSLIDHLLVRYPVPEALYEPWVGHDALYPPWNGEAAPSLKWVSWLVLIGRGASVPRAGSRFGWTVSSKRLAQLHAAPSGLTPVEALIWAEVLHAGGSQLEFERLSRHLGYLCDPTAIGAEIEVRFEINRDVDAGHAVRNRRFLHATVDWLVRHRADLPDAHLVERILDWALHRHTEDLAHDVPDHARFSWRGRTPDRARDAALEYDRRLDESNRHRRSFRWRPRGWDRELPDEGGAWTVRELTSSMELADESHAMSHCVASYDYRCAHGASAIFSLSFAGDRQVTVELEPTSRRIVQARGKNNRGCLPRELQVLRRWLDSLDDAARTTGA